MRTLLSALVLGAAACGPGFDVDNADTGGVVVVNDASTPTLDVPASGTDGGAVLTQPALAQTSSCADLFERASEFYGFDENPTGVRFFDFAELVDGDLRFPPSDSFPGRRGSNLMYSLSNYLAVGTCTDLTMPEPGEGRQLAVSGKALADGVSCAIDGETNELEMVEISDSGALVLGRLDIPWVLDGGLELRMYTYNEGTRSLCEVMRLDTREVLRLESNIALAVRALHYELAIWGDGDAGQTFVHEVTVGIPHGPFQRISE